MFAYFSVSTSSVHLHFPTITVKLSDAKKNFTGIKPQQSLTQLNGYMTLKFTAESLLFLLGPSAKGPSHRNQQGQVQDADDQARIGQQTAALFMHLRCQVAGRYLPRRVSSVWKNPGDNIYSDVWSKHNVDSSGICSRTAVDMAGDLK